MSYVAISSKFTSDVRSKLRHMRHREINTVPELDYKLNSTRTDVIKFAWGEYLHLKDQMPATWCGKMSHVNLRVELGERALRLGVELVPPLVVPPGGAPSGVLPISSDDADIQPFLAREQQLYDIAQRWDKVDKQIMDFVGKCKSVNEALKLWPQVEMYIPTEYVDRVNEKKERTKAGTSAAAEALKALDTDHLTTAAVISRMSGQE